MSFKKILRALTCTFALVGSAPSFAFAPDQPSQVLSMLEVLGPYTGALPSSGESHPFSSLGTRPSRFELNQQTVFNAQLGKEVLQLDFYVSGPDGARSFIGFTLDPDHAIGDVDTYSVIYPNNDANFPNVSYPDTTLDAQSFNPSEKRFSIIDLQRDASGQVVSLAASFDIWGRFARNPQTYQLTGRFWYNSNAAIPVPEPDSVALLLTGLAATGLISRRRKTAKVC